MENTDLHFEWAQLMAADIAAAKLCVYVSSLSLHPPRRSSTTNIALLWTALERATLNRVTVNMYLPSPSKAHPATAMNQSAAERLHAIGVKVIFLPTVRLLHAKTVSIDDKIAWVGSGNWTAAATAHNREAYLRTTSPAIARRLAMHWIHEAANHG